MTRLLIVRREPVFFSVPPRFSIGQNRISDGRKINGTAAGDPAAALR
jgi:hypothetical protein